MGDNITKDRILLGVILAPHGIKGDVHVKSFTEDPADITRYGPLTSKDGAQSFELKFVRETNKRLTVRVEGIDDRTAADALRGTELYVARDQLPDLDDASFYFEDLIGLLALDEAGVAIGTVIAVHNYGASDILEIKRDDGAGTELLPFTDAFVPNISLAEGTVTVHLPDEGGEADNQDDSEKSRKN